MKKSKLSIEEKEILSTLDKDYIKKFMTPKNDLIFRKLFGTVGKENIVKDFLEAILEIKIKSLELGKETILLPEEIDEKGCILDVRVTLEDGTMVDIEMQKANTYHTAKRALFYASKLFMTQLPKGEDYSQLKRVIIVFITDFNFLNNIECYHSKWLMTEQTNFDAHLNEMELHFIEVPKFLTSKFDTKRKLDQWLLFIDYSHKELLKEIMEENENVKNVVNDLNELLDDDVAQYLAWKRQIQRLDENTRMLVAQREGHEEGLKEGLEEGHKEGLKKGLEEGHKEGLKKGLKEGIKEGEKKATLDVAKKLKKRGFSTEEISNITSLSYDEIETLNEND